MRKAVEINREIKRLQRKVAELPDDPKTGDEVIKWIERKLCEAQLSALIWVSQDKA